MFLEAIRSEGLAHLSYVVGGFGPAVVVDPRRDVGAPSTLHRDAGHGPPTSSRPPERGLREWRKTELGGVHGHRLRCDPGRSAWRLMS